MDFVIKEKPRHRVDKKEIPQALIYEIIDGKPFYYKGCREVLKGKKTLDDIMGVADIQGWIINCILEYLFKSLDKKYKPIMILEQYKFSVYQLLKDDDTWQI